MFQSNGDYFEGCHGPDDEELHQRGDMNAGRILFGHTSYISIQEAKTGGWHTESVKMQHEPATETDRPRSTISAAFLQDFQKGMSIVRGLNVTNDAAERGVLALIQSFNSSITTDEKQKQFLFQIVAEHRRSLPNSNKSNLEQNFED